MKRLLFAFGIVALFTPAPPIQGQSCAPVVNGVVAWWRGENNVLDSIGTDNGTLVNGATFAPGKVGQAFSFDGVDDYLSVPDGAAWNFGQNDFTIGFWVNMSQIKLSMFIAHQDSGSGAAGFELYWAANYFLFTPNPVMGAIARPWSPMANQWYHLAVTRNSGTYRFYVDGQQLGNEQFDPNPVQDVTGNIRVGGYATDSRYQVAGQMDEILIYNRALTAAELQSIYAAGAAGVCTDPTQPIFTTPATLPDSAIGVAYSQTLAGALGTPPYTFTITSGALPDGLALDLNTGVISGTPTVAGDNSFTVRLADNANPQRTADPRGFTLHVRNFTGTSYTWNGSVGDWSDASRWIPNGVPDPNDEAILNGGQITVNADTTVAVLNFLFNGNNANNLGGPGPLTVTTVMNWTGGELVDGLNLNIPSTATLNISGAVLKQIFAPGVLNNSGIINWTGDGYIYASGNVTIHNFAQGLFNIQTDSVFDGLGPIINNDGLIRKNGTSGTLACNYTLNNAGTLDVESGTFLATLYGLLNNSGAINIGNGQVAVTGNYSPAASASLNVVLSGLTPGAQFGQLTVSGNASFNGALNVSHPAGFTPAVGDTFLVVSSGTHDGAFSSTSGMDLGGGVRLALSYPAQGALLTAVTLGLAPPVLPIGFAGVDYSQIFSGVNGIAPYSFLVVDGALPPGMNLSAGVLSGTPDMVGVFNFTVQVADGAGNSRQAQYSMQVLSCSLAGYLAGWWRADGNANDSIGMNNGTLNGGVTFATGKFGQAFSFDGASSINLADADTLEFNSALTIEAWIKPSDVDNYRVVFSKFGSPGNYAYQISLAPVGSLRCDWSGNGNSYDTLQTPNGLLVAGSWAHVAMTFNAGNVAIYVNGAQVASKVSAVTSIFTAGTTSPSIGRDPAGYQYYSGLIDEVRVYRRGLSASEMAADYNATSCIDVPEFTTLGALLNARVGLPYWQRLSVLLGHPPNTFALTIGTLPPGLNLSSDGLISGTPSQEGTSPFTITVTDALGKTAHREFTIAVGPQPPCVTIDGAWARWPGEASPLETINGFNGTLTTTGPGYTPGVVGQAFLFDGMSGYFQASVPDLPVGNCTLEFWMRRDADAPGGGSWVGGWGAFNGDSWAVFGIVVDGSQRIAISLDNTFLATGPVAELGRWYHVAAAFEDGYAKLYVDGVLAASAAATFSVGGGPVNIGRFPGGASNNQLAFKGAVDEPTIFYRALSAAEIQSISDAGGSGKCRSLNSPVPNSTCEVVAQTFDPLQVYVIGLGFDSFNQPVVAWHDGDAPSPRLFRWAFRQNSAWNTGNVLHEVGGRTDLGSMSFAMSDDGRPFFSYGVQNVYQGNDEVGVGIYLVDGAAQPTGPGYLVHAYHSHGQGGGPMALAFPPGASNPSWAVSGSGGENSPLYDNIVQSVALSPALDYHINSSGTRALIGNYGGSVRMSRTPGVMGGPVIISADPASSSVAVAVDENNVFHALIGTSAGVGGKLVYARSANGVDWTVTDLGPGVDFRRSRAAGIAMNKWGNPAIAYFRAGKLWYAELISDHWAHRAVGSYSGYAEQTEPATGTDLFRLTFDRDGNATIAVFDPGTTSLLLCTLNPPTITQQPVSQTVCPGAIVTLSVAASDDAILYRWQKHGSPPGEFTEQPSLTLNNVQPSDSGDYDVTVRNVGAFVKSVAVTLTVQDLVAPLISAAGPAAIIECPAMPVFTPPTATDDCDPHPQVMEVGDVMTAGCGSTYTRTKTWKAVDASLNESGTVSQTITVQDTTRPNITCPADVTVKCSGDVPAPDITKVTANDTCGAVTVTFVGDTITPGTCVNKFSIVRTYKATDACGNLATCNQTITVNDDVPPVISHCAPDATVGCASQIPAADDSAVVATDNCGAAPVITHDTDVIISGSCVNRYTIKRTYHATDACGNNSSCTQTITVNDDTAPVISHCAPNATVECASQIPAADDSAVVATDNCGAAPVITHDADVIISGSCVNRYTIKRTYHATDACGNNSSCTQTITVNDDTAPVISHCAPNATVECASQIPAADDSAVVATDNCGAAPVITHDTDVIISGSCVNRYTIKRTYHATDACGNNSSCTQTITVNDDTAPVISKCAPDAMVECASQVPAADDSAVVATDNCGAAPVITHDADVIISGSCVNRYTIKRTYHATDACGNSSSCTQTITVNDDVAPVITRGTIASCFPTQAAAEAAALAATGASDNCTPPEQLTKTASTVGTCNATITVRVADGCGNLASVSYNTRIDSTPPVLAGLPPSTAAYQCRSDVPPAPTVTASDNCDGSVAVNYSQTESIPGSSCNNIITRTWSATDTCGKAATFTQTITVNDTLPPVLSGCVNETVAAEAGQGKAMVNFTVTATDNCDGMDPVTCNPGPGFFAVGQTIVTCEAIDGCGNRGTCSFTVTITQTSAAGGQCSFTQGFYGNANGKFNGTTSFTLVGNLLAQGSLVVGKTGSRSLSLKPGDASLLQQRLPAGGTPAMLPNTGDQTLQTAVLPLGSKGKFANVFLGQTITLSLNVRLSPALLSVGTAPSFCTEGVTSGADGLRGTADDVLVSGDILTFAIPNSVRSALLNPILGINNARVQGLLELANRALAGLSTGGASLSDINDAVDAINRGFDTCRVLVDCATEAVIQDSANDGFDNRSSLGTTSSSGTLAAHKAAAKANLGSARNIKVRVSNVNATKEIGEPNHAGNAGGKSVWWRWIAPQSGPVVLQTDGSSFDTLLGVYTGNSLSNLVLVANNDDAGTSVVAQVSFQAQAGTEYQIAVDGFDCGWGTIDLSLITQWPRLCAPLERAGDQIHLCLDSQVGSIYTVEASSDLVSWIPVSSLENADGVLRFTDSAAQPARARFYRVSWEY